MLSLINPDRRPEPFDHPDWLFEAKFDGFRAAADTVRGQLISRNGNRMKRYEGVLDLLQRSTAGKGSYQAACVASSIGLRFEGNGHIARASFGQQPP